MQTVVFLLTIVLSVLALVRNSRAIQCRIGTKLPGHPDPSLMQCTANETACMRAEISGFVKIPVEGGLTVQKYTGTQLSCSSSINCQNSSLVCQSATQNNGPGAAQNVSACESACCFTDDCNRLAIAQFSTSPPSTTPAGSLTTTSQIQQASGPATTPKQGSSTTGVGNVHKPLLLLALPTAFACWRLG